RPARPGDPRARRAGGRHADARLHAPAACPAGDARSPPARLDGDARARPGALPLRGGTGGAVAARDFVLDYLYAAAALFTHLSRIGEEIVLWASREFGFARLPERAATGS